MTTETAPLNFRFSSFGSDEINSTEEYFIIDNNVVVFNQDLVHTVRITSIQNDLVSVSLDLNDGVNITKTFINTRHQIREMLN